MTYIKSKFTLKLDSYDNDGAKRKKSVRTAIDSFLEYVIYLWFKMS